jgi:hypothetical protein
MAVPEVVGSNAQTVDIIKSVAYGMVAYLIVAVGMVGNLLSIVVLRRPNLKGVMYTYLLCLAIRTPQTFLIGDICDCHNASFCYFGLAKCNF